MIKTFGSKTGKTIPCHWCGKKMLTSTRLHPLGTFEVDRWPVCGHNGGSYRRDNVVPACAGCNGTRCNAAAECRQLARAA